MKKLFFLILLTAQLHGQNNLPYKNGELLKYKVTYGLIHAGFTTLAVENTKINDKPGLHVIGKGWSVGITELLFPVRDNYESYFDPNTLRPSRFIRNIKEGGHTKNKEILFDFNDLKATVINYKKQTKKDYPINKNVKDMMMSVYYFRSLDFNKLETGEIVAFDLFFDEEIHSLKIIVLGREQIHTKFGTLNTLVIMPLVQQGRVFKENESLTIWFSDDKNKIPVKLKASILVGSIKMDLEEYKGLSHDFRASFN
jgi:Protein of unknown function (DUF3108)